VSLRAAKKMGEVVIKGLNVIGQCVSTRVESSRDLTTFVLHVYVIYTILKLVYHF
jgi:hypothetical protein